MRSESSRAQTPPIGAAASTFAALLIALGADGFARHGFAPIWAPVAGSFPARAVLIYACASLSILSGLGLLSRAYAAAAVRLLLAFLLLWWLVLRVPGVVLAPTKQEPWSGCAETAVFVAAAWVMYASLAQGSGWRGLRVGHLLYGCALIPFGTAHFVYLKETAALVPSWLPLPTYWAHFTGCSFIAAGIAIISGCWARQAAILSTCQLGLFTALVWGPIMAHGRADPHQVSEAILSAALSVAAWVVADSYRSAPTAPKA